MVLDLQSEESLKYVCGIKEQTGTKSVTENDKYGSFTTTSHLKTEL